MCIVAFAVVFVACCAKKFCSKNFWMNVHASAEFEDSRSANSTEVGRKLHVHGGRVLYLPEVVTIIDRISSGSTSGGAGTERTPLLEPLLSQQRADAELAQSDTPSSSSSSSS